MFFCTDTDSAAPSIPVARGRWERTRGHRSRGRLSSHALRVRAALLLAALLLPVQAARAEPGSPAASPASGWSLTSSPAQSSDGVYQLVWEGAGEGDLQLEEAPSERFAQPRVVYRGPDRATVVSGRADGEYHYRLRTLDGDTPGEPLAYTTVTVGHHSLARALSFFAAGLFVFVATIVLVLRGSGRSSQDGA